MQDGIYLNIPNEVYHSLDFINSSFVKSVIKNPRLAWMERVKMKKCEKTRSLTFGSLVHEMILEPEKFAQRPITPAGKKRANPEIEISESIKEELDLMAMIYNLPEHKDIRNAINASYKEVVMISNGKKIKIDFLGVLPDKILLGDLKTHSVDKVFTQNKDMHMKMFNHINDYNYLVQLQFYKEVLSEAINRAKCGEIPSDIDFSGVNIGNIQSILLTINTNAPYDIIPIQFQDHDFESAACEIMDALQIIDQQKAKHNGFEEIWDTKHQNAVLEYSSF